MNIQLLDNKIKIYDVDYAYRKYLYQYDYKVNLKNNRRFSGVLIRINQIQYLIPLTSHPKRKNGKRRNPRTTVEIYNESKELIAALLINNMIPVPIGYYSLVDVENDKFKDYLNSEHIYLRGESTQEEIVRKAKNIFNDVIIRNDEFMKSFSCDFLLLEEKMLEWLDSHT